MNERQKSDLEFIQNGNYPYFPYLPLRRKGGQVGMIQAPKPVVYLVNTFALIDGDVDLDTVEKITYDNFEELLNDGWYVD